MSPAGIRAELWHQTGPDIIPVPFAWDVEDQTAGLYEFDLDGTPGTGDGWFIFRLLAIDPNWPLTTDFTAFVACGPAGPPCDDELDLDPGILPRALLDGDDLLAAAASSLHDAADTDTFSVELQEGQVVSIDTYGVVAGCELSLELLPPAGGGGWWDGQTILRDLNGSATGAGGHLHFRADRDATWRIRVASASTPAEACAGYVVRAARWEDSETTPFNLPSYTDPPPFE
jgi:hypothetical protein